VQDLLDLRQFLQAHHGLGETKMPLRLRAGRRKRHEAATEGDILEKQVQASPILESPPECQGQLPRTERGATSIHTLTSPGHSATYLVIPVLWLQALQAP
jgi:hypothetical protein